MYARSRSGGYHTFAFTSLTRSSSRQATNRRMLSVERMRDGGRKTVRPTLVLQHTRRDDKAYHSFFVVVVFIIVVVIVAIGATVTAHGIH